METWVAQGVNDNRSDLSASKCEKKNEWELIKNVQNWPLNEHVALSSRHEDSRPIPWCRCGNGDDAEPSRLSMERRSQQAVDVAPVGGARLEQLRDESEGRREQGKQLWTQLHVWIHMGGGDGGGGSSGSTDNDGDDASSKFIRRPTTGIMTAHPVHAKPSKLIQVMAPNLKFKSNLKKEKFSDRFYGGFFFVVNFVSVSFDFWFCTEIMGRHFGSLTFR